MCLNVAADQAHRVHVDLQAPRRHGRKTGCIDYPNDVSMTWFWVHVHHIHVRHQSFN